MSVCVCLDVWVCVWLCDQKKLSTTAVQDGRKVWWGGENGREREREGEREREREGKVEMVWMVV